MNETFKLNDISDELVIFNKATIDTLFKLDNCSDCIALYVFYYKTAKWQKTNTIKATDSYVRSSLKWGNEKIRKTKETLKQHGLINVIKRTNEDGKIDGWYVEVSYLINMKTEEQVKELIEENHNYQKPLVDEPTCGFQETNALKEYIKCLKKEIEILKGKNNSKLEKPELEKEFENLWKIYPKKVDKKKSLEYYTNARNKGIEYETIKQGLDKYVEYCKNNEWYSPKHCNRWFRDESWNNEYETNIETKEQGNQLKKVGNGAFQL